MEGLWRIGLRVQVFRIEESGFRLQGTTFPWQRTLT